MLKISNVFKKKIKYKVEQKLLLSNAPYLLVFNKNENFIKYKENRKDYFEEYSSDFSQENELFFTFPYGMSKDDILMYIESEKKLDYGIDYIAYGFLEGLFYSNQINDNSIFKDLVFTNKLTPNLDPNIYEKFTLYFKEKHEK
jgi:hypothetical protein